jgi:hypothetical protein
MVLGVSWTCAMTITLPPELESLIRDKAQAEGLNVDEYVERLIREDEDWGECREKPLESTDPEFQEIQAAVAEGLEQADRGESWPAQETFSGLREKISI